MFKMLGIYLRYRDFKECSKKNSNVLCWQLYILILITTHLNIFNGYKVELNSNTFHKNHSGKIVNQQYNCQWCTFSFTGSKKWSTHTSTDSRNGVEWPFSRNSPFRHPLLKWKINIAMSSKNRWYLWRRCKTGIEYCEESRPWERYIKFYVVLLFIFLSQFPISGFICCIAYMCLKPRYTYLTSMIFCVAVNLTWILHFVFFLLTIPSARTHFPDLLNFLFY